MTTRRISTVLFDLDGTLIDTVALIMESYRYTVGEHGFTPVPDSVWLANLGIPLRIQFRHFTEDPDEIQAMVSTYLAHNQDHHDTLIAEYPGVLDQVRGLHRAGFRLGVVTSKMHGGLERGITAGGYDGLFEVLIGADDVINPKPHPEPVLMALEKLGVQADDAVFVGDSSHDMKCGRAAGVHTAAALWGPFERPDLEEHEPDFWLEQPEDITRILAGD